MNELDRIYNEDCLVGMQRIDDASIDMILCDLPYGTTACKWDTVIPFEPLWEQYKRVIKPHGAIVLTASQPFTSALVMSNVEMFKYEWIWKKTKKTGFPNANRQPLRNYESVLVFYKGQCTYNPQGIVAFTEPKKVTRKKPKRDTINAGENDGSLCGDYLKKYTNYPSQVLEIPSEAKTVHPTQKPVALFEYLIKTYTNPGETVLDNCLGSGTTAIAAINTGRHYIGFEKDAGYFDIAQKRIAEVSA